MFIGVLAPAVPQLPGSARSAKRWDYTGGYRPAERETNEQAFRCVQHPLLNIYTDMHSLWMEFGELSV